MAFPSGWTRKAPITIPAGKVAGASGSLSDFPVLLTSANLPGEMFDADGAAPAQNGGGDIRFSADEAGTNAIPLEVVSFVTAPDPANGAAELWVRVPALDKGADTTIWAWWHTSGTDSQPAATEPLGRNAVWSSTLGVWHFENASAGVDSSGNGHDLTITTTGGVGPGPWGNAVDFAGGGLNADTGAVAAFDFGAVPFTFWIVARPRSGGRRDLMSNRADNLGYEVRLTGGNKFEVAMVGVSPNFSTNLVAAPDEWHWMGFATDGAGNGLGFVDGASETGTHAHPEPSGGPFVIAAETPTGGSPLPGEVAFAAVLPTAWGDDEFNTWFNNQSAPASFAGAGAVEEAGGGSGVSGISGLGAPTLAGLQAAAGGGQRIGGEAVSATTPARIAAMGGLAILGAAGGAMAGLIATASSSVDIAGSAAAMTASPSAGSSGRLRHAGAASPAVAAPIIMVAGDIGSTGALAAVIRAAAATAAGAVAGVQGPAPGRQLVAESGDRIRAAREPGRTLATRASRRIIE